MGAGVLAAGMESTALMVAEQLTMFYLKWELGAKCCGPARDALGSQINRFYKELPAVVSLYSGERIRQLLPFIMQATAKDDILVASGVLGLPLFNLSLHASDASIEPLLSPQVLG
eukprot:COSAG02_NODE_31988_length_524_cov_0.656471_1_plen_114_part_10